jgi:uncharacterized protein (TIGR03437 family)
MGLTSLPLLRGFLLLALLVPALDAAPKLRLTTAVVGPVSIAVGSNGQAQKVEAYNGGDGTLSLTASVNVAWLTAAVGSPAPCTSRPGTCLPINIGLQTAALPGGMQTASVTVTDPNAVDAPQTITVSVQMGGGVPDQVDLYVPPNGQSDSTSFLSNGGVLGAVSTQSGGPWLSFSVDAYGSFGFAISYRIAGKHLAGMGEGNYNGSVIISGAAYTPDNRAVPVTLHVTSQPIANASPAAVKFRLPEGKRSEQFVTFSNRGLGALEISSVDVTVPAGQTWLTVDGAAAPLYKLSVDPSGLSPGVYQGSVAFASNAANGTIAVPVEVEIIPAGPPVAAFGGVVNNATFARDDPIPQGGICALFGEQLSNQDPQQGDRIPLVQQLGGATLFVNDRPTPLYFTSYGQINFQLPFETTLGEALVRVDRDGQRGNTVSVRVVERAPRILRYLVPGLEQYGIVQNYKDGTFAIPAALAAQTGVPGHPAAIGEALVMYVIGIGQTAPPVPTGAAAPSGTTGEVLPRPKVVFGGDEETDVLYYGYTPTFVGLYQVNVVVPKRSPVGDAVSVVLSQDGQIISNKAYIAVQ